MVDTITNSWITNANKAQLEIYPREFNIEPHTLREHTQNQTSEFISNSDHKKETQQRLMYLSKKHVIPGQH